MSASDEGGSWASFFGGGLLLAVIAVVLANTNVAEGENGGTQEMIGTLIFLAVIAAALYFLVRARTGNSAPVGLLLGIVAVVAIGIYWSGLPFLLGGAAVAVGRRAADQGKLPLWRRSSGRWACWAASSRSSPTSSEQRQLSGQPGPAR